jgi:Glycosyl hydrolase-like 10/Domain of unknown function
MFLALGMVSMLQAVPSRFQPAAPFPRLPWIKIDQRWSGGSFADEACRNQHLQARIMWIDGSANLGSINSDDKVAGLVAKIKSVGFNTIVLDVKPIVGRTIYPSALSEQMTAWKDKTLPKGYDPVAAFREETRRSGISFFVSMNAFSEGHSYAWRDKDKPDSQFGDPGWGYKHPELQSVLLSTKVGGPQYRLASVDQDQIPLMMNPNSPEVQERVLAFVKEVVGRYRPDGLLFDDRLRYHGLDADFSEVTRAQFEARVKSKVQWPEDVLTWTHPTDNAVGVKPGPLFDEWLAFRADTMAKFVDRVRTEVRHISPDTKFGIYAGSWYGDYGKYGSNYASDALRAGFPFLTRSYAKTGFAGDLDVLITGCYYKTATMYGAMGLDQPVGRTVEAAGDVGDRVARDRCWVYGGIQMVDFSNDLDGFEKALQAAAATTQGVMVFDLSHNVEKFWPIFERAFVHPARAPHSVPGLLDRVRAKRANWDAKGYPERPFPILEGAPGAGF